MHVSILIAQIEHKRPQGLYLNFDRNDETLRGY